MILFEIGTISQQPTEVTTTTGKTYLQFAIQVMTEKGTAISREIKIWNQDLINYAKTNLNVGMPIVVRGTPDISAYINQQGKATYSFRINANSIDLMQINNQAQNQQNNYQPVQQQVYQQPNYNNTQKLQPNPQPINQATNLQNQLLGEALQINDVTNSYTQPQLNNLNAVVPPNQFLAPQQQQQRFNNFNNPQPVNNYNQKFNNFGNN